MNINYIDYSKTIVLVTIGQILLQVQRSLKSQWFRTSKVYFLSVPAIYPSQVFVGCALYCHDPIIQADREATIGNSFCGREENRCLSVLTMTIFYFLINIYITFSNNSLARTGHTRTIKFLVEPPRTIKRLGRAVLLFAWQMRKTNILTSLTKLLILF